MEVRFAAWAENCLKEIYDYYSEEAGPDKASEIVNKIIDKAETLENYPIRGRIEEDLTSLGKGLVICWNITIKSFTRLKVKS